MILCNCRNIRNRHLDEALESFKHEPQGGVKLTCCSLYRRAAENAGHEKGTLALCGKCAPDFKKALRDLPCSAEEDDQDVGQTGDNCKIAKRFDLS